MRSLGAYLLVSAACLILGGCLPSVTLPKERLPEVIALGEGEPLEVEAEGERVVITSEMSPQVTIDHGSLVQTIAPVEKMRLDDGNLRLPGPLFGLGEKVVPADDVRSLRLQWDPPERRPQFGAGLTLLGPAGLGGVSLHWLPARWVGLEVGMLTDVRNGTLGWVGGRLMPVAIGPVRPFVGAFGHASLWGWDAFDPDSPRATEVVSYGGRLGVDVAFSRRFHLLVEANLVRPSSSADALFPGEGREWMPTGGLAAVFML